VAGTLHWSVDFKPVHAGAHHATLEIDHAGGTVEVPLTGAGESGGDGGVGGDGGAGADTTSYYACSCRTPARPGGAAPIVIAIGYLLARRRRSR